jgi:hypothetical protein
MTILDPKMIKKGVIFDPPPGVDFGPQNGPKTKVSLKWVFGQFPALFGHNPIFHFYRKWAIFGPHFWVIFGPFLDPFLDPLLRPLLGPPDDHPEDPLTPDLARG